MSSAFRRDRGFTLIEVIVSLLIITGTATMVLTAMSGATSKAMDAMARRKLRYLSQLIMADIELGKLVPGEEEEERYEEGSSDDFSGWASDDRPDEYEHFRFVVEVLREEILVGAEDEEALEDTGFSASASEGEAGSGSLLGRPVSNDDLENEEDLEEPPGQRKRLLVLAVERLGEDADDDLTLRIVTYLPVPGEEEASLGGGAEGLPGAGPGGGAAEAGAGGPGGGGAAGASGDRK